MRYTTTLLLTGRNTGIPVPDAVLAALGAGRRPAVRVVVNGYELSSTVGSMGGQALVPFSAAHRAASGLAGGDVLDVEILLDDAPRTVTVPDDLATALADAGVREAFDALAPSRRAAHVASVEGAKVPATRTRRVGAVVASLTPTA